MNMRPYLPLIQALTDPVKVDFLPNMNAAARFLRDP